MERLRPGRARAGPAHARRPADRLGRDAGRSGPRRWRVGDVMAAAEPRRRARGAGNRGRRPEPGRRPSAGDCVDHVVLRHHPHDELVVAQHRGPALRIAVRPAPHHRNKLLRPRAHASAGSRSPAHPLAAGGHRQHDLHPLLTTRRADLDRHARHDPERTAVARSGRPRNRRPVADVRRTRAARGAGRERGRWSRRCGSRSAPPPTIWAPARVSDRRTPVRPRRRPV